MKTVILAGGLGTRISEESHLRPKPMIEIGNMPILWHIMKIYQRFNYNDFVICAGYKQEIIKEFFAHYYLRHTDVTFDFRHNKRDKDEQFDNDSTAEPWRVTVVDTGLNTMTGGRIARIKKYIGNYTFMLTYGDGVCDLDIGSLLSFHEKHGKIATLTAIRPQGRFGLLDVDVNGLVRRFAEKRKEETGWINGGFMVLEPEVFNFLPDDATIFERDPLESLAKKNQLVAYTHSGFWQCMDTMRDKEYLDSLIANNQAPWLL